MLTFIAKSVVLATVLSLGIVLWYHYAYVKQTINERGFEFAKLLLEHQISWPLAFLGGVFLLRNQIEYLIQKQGVEELSIGGITTKFRQAPAQETTALPGVQGLRYRSPERRPNRPWEYEAFTKRKNMIKDDLARMLPGRDPAEQIEALMDSLAFCRIDALAEYLDRRIYGSQVQILRLLARSEAGAELSQVQAIYDRAKADFPEVYREYPFDKYVSFLRNVGVIESLPGDQIKITAEGQAFLEWADGRNFPVNWPY